VTIPNALDKLKALRGVYFDFKELDGVYKTLPQDRQVGFIAQEVEAVLPEIVSTGADGMKMLATSSITALLTQAVQELNEKVDNALLTIGEDGSVTEQFTAQKLTITDSAEIIGTITASDYAIDSTKLNQVGSLASLPQSENNTVSIADAINALDKSQQEQKDSIAALQTDIAGVQDQTASQSAQLAAQSEVLESTSLKTEALEGELTTQKSALDSLREQIAAQLGTTSAENDPVLTAPDELIATGSASLASFSSNTMSTKELTVSDTLSSLGETRLGNTFLAGDFVQDGTFSITGGNEINVTGSGIENLNDGILYIQKSALARAVDFFNGLVTIDNTGVLKVPSVTVADFKVVAKKISGTATIEAGQNSVIIDNPLVTQSSRILVTPTSQNPAILAVTEKKDGESFTVSTALSGRDDITFDWWMVQEVEELGMTNDE
jgi:hypothetical protein